MTIWPLTSENTYGPPVNLPTIGERKMIEELKALKKSYENVLVTLSGIESPLENPAMPLVTTHPKERRVDPVRENLRRMFPAWTDGVRWRIENLEDMILALEGGQVVERISRIEARQRAGRA